MGIFRKLFGIKLDNLHKQDSNTPYLKAYEHKIIFANDLISILNAAIRKNTDGAIKLIDHCINKYKDHFNELANNGKKFEELMKKAKIEILEISTTTKGGGGKSKREIIASYIIKLKVTTFSGLCNCVILDVHDKIRKEIDNKIDQLRDVWTK